MKIDEEKGYQYYKPLSKGGEGEGYLVCKEGRTFVAKVVPLLDENARRLLEALRRASIPNVPQFYEILDDQDRTVIIREYIEGSTLYDEIKKNGTLTLARSRAVILKICDTLAALHALKPHPVIYRDLKPENVIVLPDGDIRLIDFGIARYHRQEATRDTVIAGTRGYTAPEVMAGLQSDERSNVYSAGLLFYEMLTGKNITGPPYQVRPVAEADRWLPGWLDPVIKKATAIDPTDRYASVTEFAARLENPNEGKPERKKRRILAAVAAAIVLLLGAAGVWGADSFRAKSYGMVLALDFDDEQDSLWVFGNGNPGGSYAVANGQLTVSKESCNIDYHPEPGMMVHYRVSQPRQGTVGLSQYRINAGITFECLYRERGTGDLPFSGLTFPNAGQFVDAIIYVTPDNDAVYAIAADEDAGRICYTAYRIPDYMRDDTLYMEINDFSQEGDVVVESVYVAEGSLQGYLKDHLTSYGKNRARVDAFLAQETAALPEIAF